MALEDVITANTAALERHAALLEKVLAAGIRLPMTTDAETGEGAPATEQQAKRGPGRPRKDAQAAGAAATEAAPAAQSEPEKPAVAAAPVPSAEEVKAAVFAVRDKLGEAAAKNLIKTAGGADKLGAVAEDKRAALIAACKVALEAPAPAEDDDGGL